MFDDLLESAAKSRVEFDPELSVGKIAELIYPDDAKKRREFLGLLKKEIEENRLSCARTDYPQAKYGLEKRRVNMWSIKKDYREFCMGILNAQNYMYFSLEDIRRYRIEKHVVPYKSVYYISKKDFKAWLQDKGKWPLDSACLLSGWWPDELSEIEAALKEYHGDKYRPCWAEQVQEILAMLDELEIPRKEIPEADKKRIRESVKLTDDVFNKAWSAAQAAGIIRIQGYKNRVKGHA